jgi:tRNA dimethylallyltransferase
LPPKTLISIIGPTASGKTALAIRLAQHFHTHILSADSRQFYRELKIGSAMPAQEELEMVPHHFVGHLSVKDEYNVSRYETQAIELITELFGEYDTLILCGGSGLYVNAVCHGIDELPDPDPQLRKELKEKLEQQGLQCLQHELLRLDPEYYRLVDLKNPIRIIRALEVCMTTGIPYSRLRRNKPRQRPFSIKKIGLQISPEQLAERIAKRTALMLASGLQDEARMLYPLRHLNALNTVGYKELFAHFDGLCSLDEAVNKININTRKYAKRQHTWFRKDPEIRWCRTDKGIKEAVAAGSGSRQWQ